MAGFEARSYTISDFIEWHETDKLQLSPDFQRRGVWSATAKSFLIDTILKGKPFPKLIIMQDFIDGRAVRIVVDGQQRLRAIFDFYNDAVRISRAHSREYAGLRYSGLNEEIRSQFLQYPVSVDVIFSAPRSELLDIFARINRYTVKLNKQELLNAQYSGYFKTTAFELGFRFVEYWINARVMTSGQVSRMAEAELASDLLATLCGGILSSKSVENFYRRFEEEEGEVFQKAELFSDTMAVIGSVYPAEDMRSTCWTRKHMFYSLFTATSHLIAPLPGIDPFARADEVIKNHHLIRAVYDSVSAEFTEYKDIDGFEGVSQQTKDFLRASTRATTDAASRLVRMNYILNKLSEAI